MKPGAATILVEDHLVLREIIAEWLEPDGYRVLTAEDGAAALRVLEKQPVDLIVTDIQMPVMDGFTMLKQLRASGARVPAAIFVSSFSTAVLPRREIFSLGVQELLPKPFTDKQLLEAVRRILRPRQEVWEVAAKGAPVQVLAVSMESAESARESGLLSFGRGGFCVWSAGSFEKAAVRFDLEFTERAARIVGEGMIRWTETTEMQVGVEITRLEAASLEEGIRLTAGEPCYIPRSSRAAT